MDQNLLKDELFHAIELMRQELDAFYNGLTAEEKERRGSLQKWAARDVLTHLAFWEGHLNQVFEKGIKGEKIPAAGDYLDRVNDGVLFAHIDQPIEEALVEEKTSYREFMKFLEGISAEDVVDTKKYVFLDGRTVMDRALGTFVYHIGFHISDYFIKNGRREKALELQEKLTELLIPFPRWKANSIYNLACFYALNGMKAEAIEQLKLAFKEKEDLIEWSRQDSDLDALRDMPEYQALIQ